MNKIMALSLVATLTAGVAVGGVVTHQFMANVQVTCPAAARLPSPANDFFKSTPMPVTGKQY